MTATALLVSFFLFTLLGVSAAGYLFVVKPARAEGDDAEIPVPSVLSQPDLPAPRQKRVLCAAPQAIGNIVAQRACRGPRI